MHTTHTEIASFALPAIGTRGDYILPAIIVRGVQLAPEVRYPVEVVGHIGVFRLQLQELQNRRMHIETHYTSFQPIR